jgi:hypothetical protein
LTGYWKQLIIFLFDIQCFFQSGSECGPWTKIIGNSCLVIQKIHLDFLWFFFFNVSQNKKIISCFQYPVKTTVLTVSRKSFHTGVVIWHPCFICGYISTNDVFFTVQTSPNMIGLTVKNIIIKKQLILFFKSSWCSK